MTKTLIFVRVSCFRWEVLYCFVTNVYEGDPKRRRLRKAELLIRRSPRGNGEINFFLILYFILKEYMFNQKQPIFNECSEATSFKKFIKVFVASGCFTWGVLICSVWKFKWKLNSFVHKTQDRIIVVFPKTQFGVVKPSNLEKSIKVNDNLRTLIDLLRPFQGLPTDDWENSKELTKNLLINAVINLEVVKAYKK